MAQIANPSRPRRASSLPMRVTVKRSAGQYFETTEEIYSYFLNVLPPLDFTVAT